MRMRLYYEAGGFAVKHRSVIRMFRDVSIASGAYLVVYLARRLCNKCSFNWRRGCPYTVSRRSLPYDDY